MPYNPPEYAGFIESAGFTKVKDLLAWEIDAQATMPDRIVRVSRTRSRAPQSRGT